MSRPKKSIMILAAPDHCEYAQQCPVWRIKAEQGSHSVNTMLMMLLELIEMTIKSTKIHLNTSKTNSIKCRELALYKSVTSSQL